MGLEGCEGGGGEAGDGGGYWGGEGFVGGEGGMGGPVGWFLGYDGCLVLGVDRRFIRNGDGADELS